MNQPESTPTNEAVFVSLITGPQGTDCVAIELAGGEVLMLSPAQARSLATNLITAVNRAEVKASLQASTNLWRRMSDSEKRLAGATG